MTLWETIIIEDPIQDEDYEEQTIFDLDGTPVQEDDQPCGKTK